MKLTRRLTAVASLIAWLSGCTGRENAPSNRSLDLLVLPALASSDLLPADWEPYQFERIPRRTQYSIVVDEGGRPALRARAESSASALRRQVAIDPASMRFVEWTWKIESSLSTADLRRKSGDDCAARLLLLYEDHRMLVYVWAGERESNEVLTSPYSERIRLIPIRRGDGDAGKWRSERRNHHDDFRRAFVRDPARLGHVAWMADTDNTGGEATAYFGSLRFLNE